jgi:hypothetical protein
MPVHVMTHSTPHTYSTLLLRTPTAMDQYSTDPTGTNARMASERERTHPNPAMYVCCDPETSSPNPQVPANDAFYCQAPGRPRRPPARWPPAASHAPSPSTLVSSPDSHPKTQVSRPDPHPKAQVASLQRLEPCLLRCLTLRVPRSDNPCVMMATPALLWPWALAVTYNVSCRMPVYPWPET